MPMIHKTKDNFAPVCGLILFPETESNYWKNVTCKRCLDKKPKRKTK